VSLTADLRLRRDEPLPVPLAEQLHDVATGRHGRREAAARRRPLADHVEAVQPGQRFLHLHHQAVAARQPPYGVHHATEAGGLDIRTQKEYECTYEGYNADAILSWRSASRKD